MNCRFLFKVHGPQFSLLLELNAVQLQVVGCSVKLIFILLFFFIFVNSFTTSHMDSQPELRSFVW